LAGQASTSPVFCRMGEAAQPRAALTDPICAQVLVQRRCVTLETIAPLSDDRIFSLPASTGDLACARAA
jgi:hypothetical protein